MRPWGPRFPTARRQLPGPGTRQALPHARIEPLYSTLPRVISPVCPPPQPTIGTCPSSTVHPIQIAHEGSAIKEKITRKIGTQSPHPMRGKPRSPEEEISINKRRHSAPAPSARSQLGRLDKTLLSLSVRAVSQHKLPHPSPPPASGTERLRRTSAHRARLSMAISFLVYALLRVLACRL